MQAVLHGDPMAKKKVVSVQIAEDLVKSLRIVSALSDRPMATIVDDILRPVVTKMEAEELAKHAKQIEAPAAAPKPKGSKP